MFDPNAFLAPQTVLMQVPVHLVADVAAYIEDRLAAPTEEESMTLDERRQRKLEAWDEEKLQKLHLSNVTTAQRVASIMDVLAFDPWNRDAYNRAEICQLTSHTQGEIANAFTRMESHFESHYGTFWWPFFGTDGAEFDPARSGTWYWMPAEIASLWREIRGEVTFSE